MLDREVVKEFLDSEFEDLELEIPEDISREALVEAFCQYTEDDYYEWLKDNFKSFFNHGSPDWEWVRGRIKAGEQQGDCQGISGYCRPPGAQGGEPV